MACTIAMILAVYFLIFALFLFSIIVSRKICKISGIWVSALSKKCGGRGYSLLEYAFEWMSSRII